MKRIVVFMLTTALFLVGCGNTSDTDGSKSAANQATASAVTDAPESAIPEEIIITPSELTAIDIVYYFSNKGQPVNNVLDYDEETDPNNLLGRPKQYTSKVNFADTRLEQYDTENPVGGSIEVFDSAKDAQARLDYIESVQDSASIFVQYNYLEDHVLFRLDKELTPTQADEYEMLFTELMESGANEDEIAPPGIDNTELEDDTSVTTDVSEFDQSVYDYFMGLLDSDANPIMELTPPGLTDEQILEWARENNERVDAYEEECVKKTAEFFNITEDEVNDIFIRVSVELYS